MRYINFLLTICILLFSCKKDTASPAVRGSEYFPNSLGNFWRYEYVDSVTNKSILVDVNITGNTVLPGGQNAKIWTYTYPDHIDTNFVYQVGDTIRFADRGLSVRNAYIIPLVLNNQWRYAASYIHDSTRVVENRDYNLNNQNFDNSFLLYEYGYLPNDYWNSSEWFSPNIGMISKTERDALLITNQFTTVYWKLIAYNLK